MLRLLLATSVLTSCGRYGFEQGLLAGNGSADASEQRRVLVEPALNILGSSPTDIMSTTTLVSGEEYILRASGKYRLGGGNRGTMDVDLGDAEYWDWFPPPPDTDPRDICDDGQTNAGLSIDHVPDAKEKTYDWGPFRDDHVYEIQYIGQGRPLTARINDSFYANNMGSLQLEIFKLE